MVNGRDKWSWSWSLLLFCMFASGPKANKPKPARRLSAATVARPKAGEGKNAHCVARPKAGEALHAPRDSGCRRLCSCTALLGESRRGWTPVSRPRGLAPAGSRLPPALAPGACSPAPAGFSLLAQARIRPLLPRIRLLPALARLAGREGPLAPKSRPCRLWTDGSGGAGEAGGAEGEGGDKKFENNSENLFDRGKWA